jgi:CubicO group peptidase (beta-lactamase class C family)
MLLGMIIEKVSGQSYYDYVQRNVYDRAGMNDTGFYDPKQPTPKLAIGYTKPQGGGEEIENTGMREFRGGPAGGGYSTAGDMLKFHVALRENKLLDPEHTRTVLTGKVDTGTPMGRYGYRRRFHESRPDVDAGHLQTARADSGSVVLRTPHFRQESVGHLNPASPAARRTLCRAAEFSLPWRSGFRKVARCRPTNGTFLATRLRSSARRRTSRRSAAVQ